MTLIVIIRGQSDDVTSFETLMIFDSNFVYQLLRNDRKTILCRKKFDMCFVQGLIMREK